MRMRWKLAGKDRRKRQDRATDDPVVDGDDVYGPSGKIGAGVDFADELGKRGPVVENRGDDAERDRGVRSRHGVQPEDPMLTCAPIRLRRPITLSGHQDCAPPSSPINVPIAARSLRDRRTLTFRRTQHAQGRPGRAEGLAFPSHGVNAAALLAPFRPPGRRTGPCRRDGSSRRGRDSRGRPRFARLLRPAIRTASPTS